MKNKNVIIMISVYAVILILIGVFQPHEIDWRPTFAARDKIPYGTYIMKERLTDMFPGSEVETTTETVYQTLHKKHFTNTNYLLVEGQWEPAANDIRELIRFADEGNNVFIASPTIPFGLRDTLGIYQRYAVPEFIKKITKTDTTRSLAISLVNPAFAKDSVYEFEISYSPEYFSPVNQSSFDDVQMSPEADSNKVDLAKKAVVISTVSHIHPIYVRIPIGKGNIYLHSYPFAFTNYYLVKDSTRRYAENCLSYLPNGKVLWDEHYKMDPSQKHLTTLGFILGNPSLRWAYYTGALFMLIFVLFSIKRRQRIIPVVAPFRNTTLEFTETVGRLYFNRGDHKNIAEKKIRHFLEYVRSRYYIETQELDEDFIHKLSAKSGLEPERVKYMVMVMKSQLTRSSIADAELIQLNELIEYFKKHSN